MYCNASLSKIILLFAQDTLQRVTKSLISMSSSESKSEHVSESVSHCFGLPCFFFLLSPLPPGLALRLPGLVVKA